MRMRPGSPTRASRLSSRFAACIEVAGGSGLAALAFIGRGACVGLVGLLLLAGASSASAQETAVQYLSGTDKDHTVPWDFMVSGGQRAGEWTTIPVPSNWELQGFGTYNYGTERNKASEQGQYRHRFTVPADWRGRRVFLVFEGSMTDTEARVNGQLAGPVHQGAFYEFRYDVTPLIKVGEENLLEVTVSKQSANASVNRAERDADFWVFGGIFRPVYLAAYPAEHIARTAIDARADGSVRLQAFLRGITASTARGARVVARLERLDGTTQGVPFSVSVAQPTTSVAAAANGSGEIAGVAGNAGIAGIARAAGAPAAVRTGEGGESVAADGETAVTLRTRLLKARTWNAEHPELYRVKVSLMRGATVLHTVTERFGFRTIEVRARDGIYVNGARVLLKGVDHHEFWPESGRTSSRERALADVHLIKDMNMNAVRMSHYPPDKRFLDACDELGLYVLDELTGWQKFYDTDVGKRLVPELVRRDVNHPSILFWDNGNEGGFNLDLDGDYATYDPQQRPVLHPWDVFSGIDTTHYLPYDCCAGQYLHGRNLIMPTEFQHGLYDGGAGAGLRDMWGAIERHPLGAGAFIWVFADEGVVRTDRHGEIDTFANNAPDGIVGPHHEKEASFFTIKELWSPVRIDRPLLPPGFDGRLTVENHYSFTNVAQGRFRWQLLDFPDPGHAADKSAASATSAPAAARDGIGPGSDAARGAADMGLAHADHRVALSGSPAAPSIAPGASGTLDLRLPSGWRGHDALELTAWDHTGRELYTWRWMLRSPADIAKRIISAAPASSASSAVAAGPAVSASSSVSAASSPSLRDVGDTLVLEAAGTEITIEKATARIARVRRNGNVVSITNGPRLVAGEATLKELKRSVDPDGTQVVEATFDGALRLLRWRLRASGWLSLDYRLKPQAGPQPYVGLTFDYPEANVTGLRWLGRGPYRVWRNRLDGVEFDVWDEAANEGVTGAVWQYPEFRGHHADLYWATLATTEQPITIVSETEGLFLRVLTPAFPKDARETAVPFPPGDLSILHAIAAVGGKFQPATAFGPSSQPNLVNGRTGTYEGRLDFFFGAVTP
jgi:hypothetical protein